MKNCTITLTICAILYCSCKRLNICFATSWSVTTNNNVVHTIRVYSTFANHLVSSDAGRPGSAWFQCCWRSRLRRQLRQSAAQGAVSEPRGLVGAALWLVWIRRRRRRDPSPLIGPPGSAPGPLPLLCLSDGDAGARAKGLAARAWSPLLKLLGLRHVLHDCGHVWLPITSQFHKKTNIRMEY